MDDATKKTMDWIDENLIKFVVPVMFETPASSRAALLRAAQRAGISSPMAFLLGTFSGTVMNKIASKLKVRRKIEGDPKVGLKEQLGDFVRDMVKPGGFVGDSKPNAAGFRAKKAIF